MGGKGEPVGLLGSDVLSRFGAIRIDFGAGTLVLPGPEGAALTQSSPFTGSLGAPPAALTQGEHGTTVPLTVTPAPGDVSLGVAVRFDGGRERDFIVDTGSSQSVVSSGVARAQSLASTDLAQRQSTVCSVITVPLVHSGPWSVPGVTPAPPAHRFDQFRHHQPVGHPGAAGLGSAASLRLDRPRLRRRPDGAGLIRPSAAPRASSSSPGSLLTDRRVSAPSRNTPCSVKVSMVPDGAGANSTVVTDTERNVVGVHHVAVDDALGGHDVPVGGLVGVDRPTWGTATVDLDAAHPEVELVLRERRTNVPSIPGWTRRQRRVRAGPGTSG